MSRSKRLQIVLELAQTEENQAAEAYEMANRLYKEDVAKLDELSSYYNEYEKGFSTPALQMRVEDMARQRGFLIQLSEAKQQQSQIIQQRKNIAQTYQARWQKAHLKRRAMSDLIGRLKQDEEKVLSRKEEKMLDEWYLQTTQTRTQNSVFQ